MTTMSACPFGAGYDFTDPDVLLRGIPVEEFAQLRKTAPVWWNEQGESIFNDGGYWVITRHEDIKAISRNGGDLCPPTPRARSCGCRTASPPSSST